MSEIDPQEFGEMRAELANLKTEVAGLRVDMRAVLQTLEQAAGGWKTLLIVGGAAASLSAFVSWALTNLRFK